MTGGVPLVIHFIELGILAWLYRRVICPKFEVNCSFFFYADLSHFSFLSEVQALPHQANVSMQSWLWITRAIPDGVSSETVTDILT